MNVAPALAPSRSGWREEFELGHARMDATHREFVACVDALLAADDAALGAALGAFEHHAREHFDEEDDAMRASAYGPAGCHIDEHAAVLGSLQQVKDMLARGRVDVVRAFGRALADWFPRHVQAMDAGLAAWLVQQQLGGAPIMVKRRR
jgi:hemerythrin